MILWCCSSEQSKEGCGQDPWLLSLSHGVATGHLCLEVMSSRCSLSGAPEDKEVDTHSLPQHPGALAPGLRQPCLTVALLLPLPASESILHLADRGSSRSPVSHSGGLTSHFRAAPTPNVMGPSISASHIPQLSCTGNFRNSQHSHLRASVLAGPLPWNILSPVTQAAPPSSLSEFTFTVRSLLPIL